MRSCYKDTTLIRQQRQRWNAYTTKVSHCFSGDTDLCLQFLLYIPHNCGVALSKYLCTVYRFVLGHRSHLLNKFIIEFEFYICNEALQIYHEFVDLITINGITAPFTLIFSFSLHVWYALLQRKSLRFYFHS